VPVFAVYFAKSGTPSQHMRDLHIDQMRRLQCTKSGYPTFYRCHRGPSQQHIYQDGSV
jgi:ligand-binding sensor protein